jgi:hypothetical protein
MPRGRKPGTDTSKATKAAHTPEALKKQSETKKVNVLLKDVIYNKLKESLLAQDKSGIEYYSRFLDKAMDEAMKDPSGKMGLLVFNLIAKENAIEELDKIAETERNKDVDFLHYKLLKGLFKEQRDLLMDDSQYRKQIVICGRRSGKTYQNARRLVWTCIKPNSPCLYMNLNFTNAISQMWDEVQKCIEEVGLRVKSQSKADGTITFTNGSSITFRGNNNKGEADKARGYKYRLVIIDEIGHQVNMNYLMDEVLRPCMADYEDSVLVCTGTPPRVPHTWAEKAWNDKTFKQYHWNMFNNPHMPNPDAFIDDECESKGVTRDSSFIQREYYGIIGCYDTEAQVFKGRQTYIIPNELKELNFTNICIGVDFGFSDYNSVISLAYNKNTRQAWVIRENKFNHSDITTIVNVIKEHDEAAKEALLAKGLDPEVDVFCDPNEKSIVAELKRNYAVRAYGAWKHDKAMAIEQLAEELRTGRMVIPLHGALDDEMDSILYKRDEGTDAILPELDEELGIHPDAMFALLYASRQYFHEIGLSTGGESKDKRDGWN